MNKDLISEIVDILTTKEVYGYGMQKTGTGTFSLLAKQRENIHWQDHGIFWSDSSPRNKKNLALACFKIPPWTEYMPTRGDGFLKNHYQTPEKLGAGPDHVSVCLIRNPFELYSSIFYHGTAGSNNVQHFYDKVPDGSLRSFKKFIMSLEKVESLYMPLMATSPFFAYYDNSGTFVPDVAIKLEALDEIIEGLGGWTGDVAYAMKKHGSRSPLTPGGVRHKSQKPKGLKTEDLYDDEMKDLIRSIFKKDLECFGYDFNLCDDRPFVRKKDIIKLEDERYRKAVSGLKNNV